MTYTNEQIEAMALDSGRILKLAAEIRRVDGGNKCGAAELAERLMPFIDTHLSAQMKMVVTDEMAKRAVKIYEGMIDRSFVPARLVDNMRAALEAALKEMQK